MSDPRDKGFNYGTGWGSDPKPACYQDGLVLAHRLRKAAQAASAKAWTLDTALWRVRIATTITEKEAAVLELLACLAHLDAPQEVALPPPHFWSDA